MQHGNLDKIKVLKTQRDFKSDGSKPNSRSVMKSVRPVRPVLHTGQTSCTCSRTSLVHWTCLVLLPNSRDVSLDMSDLGPDMSGELYDC
jgi:hypothetical protein